MQAEVVQKMVEAYVNNTRDGKTSAGGVNKLIEELLKAPAEEREATMKLFETRVRKHNNV